MALVLYLVPFLSRSQRQVYILFVSKETIIRREVNLGNTYDWLMIAASLIMFSMQRKQG